MEQRSTGYIARDQPLNGATKPSFRSGQKLVSLLRNLALCAGLLGLAASVSARSVSGAAANRPPIVAAAHSLAVKAGMDGQRRGGDAVDAAIAVQAMLGW